jgi:TonB family protein
MIVGAAITGATVFAISRKSSDTQSAPPIASATIPTPTTVPPVTPPIAAPPIEVAVAPVVVPPKNDKVRVALMTNTPGTALTMRGRTYRDAKFETQVAPGSEPELIEISAPKHVTRRYWITLSRDAVITTNLNKGAGVEEATAEQTVVALGDAPLAEITTSTEPVNPTIPRLPNRAGRFPNRRPPEPPPKNVAVGSASPATPSQPILPDAPAPTPVVTAKIEEAAKPADPIPPVTKPAPIAVAPTPKVDSVKAGTMDKAATQTAVRKQISGVNECVERARMDNAGLSGTISVLMQVSPTGKVTGASTKSSSFGNTKVDNCILSEIRTWTLPAPAGGVATTISYPFSFQ